MYAALDGRRMTQEGGLVSELWKLIQAHLDEYGVREAALARRMGTAPQTLNSWKKRGMRQLPSRELLEALAREIRQPYQVVLRAVLQDLQYLSDEELGEVGNDITLTVAKASNGLMEVRPTDLHGGDLDPVREALAHAAVEEEPALLAATLVTHLADEGADVSRFGDTFEARRAYFRELFEDDAERAAFWNMFGLHEGERQDGPATTPAGDDPATHVGNQDDFDVAARTTGRRTKGQQAREQQDRDAER